VQTLNRFLLDALVIEPGLLSFESGAADSRGDVTQFLLVPATGEGRP
jgi:hypothetical protein